MRQRAGPRSERLAAASGNGVGVAAGQLNQQCDSPVVGVGYASNRHGGLCLYCRPAPVELTGCYGRDRSGGRNVRGSHLRISGNMLHRRSMSLRAEISRGASTI